MADKLNNSNSEALATPGGHWNSKVGDKEHVFTSKHT